MKWRFIFVSGLLLGGAASLGAHDFFLRPGSFFAAPGATVRLRALNGTFSKSENSIARDRLRDLSVVGSAGRIHPDTTTWSTTGDTSVFTVATGPAGTYVTGVSLKPREITLKAAEFNQYLADDGIPDVLAARRRDGELERDATERYSKHVKALLQVGSARSGAFSTLLGYPAELVPLDNPYVVGRGRVRVRALVDGQPAANQLIMIGGRTPTGGRLAQRQMRTDTAGVVSVNVNARGQWYVKFINMERYRGTEKIDYESKWATLTFEVR